MIGIRLERRGRPIGVAWRWRGVGERSQGQEIKQQLIRREDLLPGPTNKTWRWRAQPPRWRRLQLQYAYIQ